MNNIPEILVKDPNVIAIGLDKKTKFQEEYKNSKVNNKDQQQNVEENIKVATPADMLANELSPLDITNVNIETEPEFIDTDQSNVLNEFPTSNNTENNIISDITERFASMHKELSEIESIVIDKLLSPVIEQTAKENTSVDLVAQNFIEPVKQEPILSIDETELNANHDTPIGEMSPFNISGSDNLNLGNIFDEPENNQSFGLKN